MVKREVSIESRVEKAMSFHGRVEILQSINESPKYCEEIAKTRDRKPSGIFQHAQQLLGAGLIETFKGDENERNVLYKITEAGKQALKDYA